MEALGLRLAMRGRSARDLPRSCSPSDMKEEEDDMEETWMRLGESMIPVRAKQETGGKYRSLAK
jgi:hypothetical protein